MPALHRYSVTTTLASVGASTEVHAIRLATPSTRRCRPIRYKLSTRGTGSTDAPALVQVYRGITGGLTAGTGATPAPVNPGMPASLITATTQMTVGTIAGGAVLDPFIMPAAASVYTEPVDEDAAPVTDVSSFLDFTIKGTGTALGNVTLTVWYDE